MNIVPILELKNHIAECASRVSPVRAKEFGEFAEAQGLSIEFTHDVEFSIGVTTNGKIILPIGALNYLWCSTNMFVVLYESYVTSQGKGADVLDTGENKRTSEAVELFRWSKLALDSGDNQWPLTGVRPSLSHDYGDTVHIVNEVFLCSLAWILHHERAHIALGHRPKNGSESIKQELEADQSASDWVLDGCETELDRQKRAFGIATSFLAIALLDDPHKAIANVTEFTTHPPDLERLLTNLGYAQLSPDNIVFSYCLVVLQFCIAQYSFAKAADSDAAQESQRSLDATFRNFLEIYRTRHQS